MTRERFLELFSDEVGANGFYLDKEKEVFVFRKPLSLWKSETDETEEFDSIGEFLDSTYEGRKIADIIGEMESLDVTISGSVGGGDNKTFKFNHAKGDGKDKTKDILPAYANVRIKSKTLEGAMQEFRDQHANADHEWAYEVDPQGYVHQYKEGNSSSVSIGGRHKDNMILHNHPSGGAFSDSDLISTALGNQKGIVASGSKGDYIFQKNGGHFKAAEFVKAVKRAKLVGKDYDDAVNKWLKANQKKYGYRYEFKKASKSKKK